MFGSPTTSHPPVRPVSPPSVNSASLRSAFWIFRFLAFQHSNHQNPSAHKRSIPRESASISFHGTYASFVFILLRTLLHRAILQPLSDQWVPHSLSKTPGGGWARISHQGISIFPVSLTDHGPLLPAPFNFQLSTLDSSSTIPALHSEAYFTPGDR
jgi:hypothetical protein